MKLLITTHNRDKLSEIRALLAGIKLEILSLDEYPELPEVVEDRDTIEGNAAKKALETAIHTGICCLADDTGLFIDALDGAPGVYAARFAGESCTYRDNRLKALDLLKDKADRKAQFKTAAVLAAPDGIIAIRQGVVTGKITTQELGDQGFGYDSIFELDGTGKTYAQMDAEIKNEISHRALALKAILPILKTLAQLD